MTDRGGPSASVRGHRRVCRFLVSLGLGIPEPPRVRCSLDFVAFGSRATRLFERHCVASDQSESTGSHPGTHPGKVLILDHAGPHPADEILARTGFYGHAATCRTR